MDAADLDRMGRMAEAAAEPRWGDRGYWSDAYARDVAALVAEVRRLRGVEEVFADYLRRWRAAHCD